MKYRWGFLDENDIFTECQPIVDDSTAIDFSQESNEIFYRGKLNGSIAFRFEFDDILSKGYNYEHRIVLQWYDADNDLWKEVWKGRFALTDCEIDYDTNTITVQPTTIDRYTKVLDHIEDEYNLVRLGAQQKPVNILIRPVVQLYALNDSKISNFVGGNSWEASCDTVGAADIDNFNFLLVGEAFACSIKFTSDWGDIRAGQTVLFSGVPDYSGTPRRFDITGRYWNGYGYTTMTLTCTIVIYSDHTNFIVSENGTNWVEASFDEAGLDAAITIFTLTPQIVVDANAQWTKMYSRTICQTELTNVTIDGTTYQLYDLPATDMAGANLNFNKVLKAKLTKNYLSGVVQIAPTEWGLSYDEKYFIKPADTATYHYYPVGQSQWKYISWWVSPEVSNGVQLTSIADSLLKAERRIKDGVLLEQAILKLLQKAGWSGTLESGILGGTENYAGYVFLPVLTAKSNVISSYYDTPAQNAPISLLKIFSMLKQAYKIYWHIDNNNKIHFENVAYYDNGFSYSEDAPDVLVDLESEIHTNTKNNKVFGQNKIKFDKQDMPAQFTFAWMDKLTRPFDGFPINCLDAYVQKGLTDEKQVGDFSTDVDCILSSPNDVSKEGFVLFALPYKDGAFQDTLQIEKLRITNEAGETYNVTVQNAEAAFAKIHEFMWRYSLPCENVNINNEDTTAKTIGRFKLQNVEFTDVVMADILKDIDNCNKVIRTQQGNGHIKTLSINLNSLVAKGDLLFDFIGRWYYLKGLALGNSIVVNINGESITIEVNANKFSYKYKEPIATLTFGAADVVSVNFNDCDNLDNLTSCDAMFDGCEELLAVDFGGKTFGAVTSANYMFRGCVALTTLICPDSSTWKADLDFGDCPDLTTESLYDLIKFLYYYNSGVHTITPNATMWNALDAATQNDLLAKAAERGWTINIPAAYSITGQSAASTVYATINGSPVEIPVTAGSWQYDYNAALTSFSFANDADVTDIDFSLSDGLVGVTSLNNAFKDCAGLTSVDFTNCDLSNVASASDAFANCSALYELIIPADSWQPDIDLSASVMPKTEMLNVINGLYVYTSGTHTISFNSTIWDAMSVADQQIVFDAADAKGWTTNAVAVVYVIRGTSSAATETFNIQFIQDGSLTPDAAETITVSVDGNGDWEFSYMNKKIYSLEDFCRAQYYYTTPNTTLLTIDFTNADDLTKCVSLRWAFSYTSALQNIIAPQTFENVAIAGDNDHGGAFQATTALLTMPNATFTNLVDARKMFRQYAATKLELQSATFENVVNQKATGTPDVGMFSSMTVNTISLPNATFANIQDGYRMFWDSHNLTTFDLPSATFASLTNARGMFEGCSNLAAITFGANLNLDNVKYMGGIINNPTPIESGMFYNCGKLTSIDFSGQTFVALETMRGAFWGCTLLQSVDMSDAVCGELTDCNQAFRLCTNLISVNWSSATFAKLSVGVNAFYQCSNLTTIDVPQNSTAILQTSSASDGTFNLQYSPLTYTSIYKIANWLSNLTGYTAHTITFKTSAWNALSTAEQNTIDSILSGKNWNRAIA